MDSTADHPTSTAPPATGQLATRGRAGMARLAVRDLARSISFYERALGLRHQGTEGAAARMGSGSGPAVLELVEEPDARPAGRHAGLYHVAILYPSRLELSRVARRLAACGHGIEGASDHGTHEAFYLGDPDGNGLELAADRPRASWPGRDDAYGSGPRPLDLADLLALTAHEPLLEQADERTTVGHLHLHVGDIGAALAFYRDLVGLELQARLPSAAFLSVGDYHHHLGVNVWRGQGVPPAPGDSLGLRHWTLLVPGRDDVDRLASRLAAADVPHTHDGGTVAVRDPWNTELRVSVEEPQPRAGQEPTVPA